MKKVTVLKSMRTTAGAEEWMRAFASRYEDQGELKVVSTDTLKSFDIGMDAPIGMSSHVILEQDLSPVVEVIKEGEFSEIVKALVDSGFMEIGTYGPCLTEKWHEALDKTIANAMKETFKAVDHNYQFTGEVADGYGEFVTALGGVLKALEDAEKLANIANAPENAEFGHDNPDAKAISDGQVAAATKKMQGHEDLNQVTEEGISDEEVESVEQSRDVKKSSHGKAPNDVTEDDVQGTAEPENLEEAAKKLTKKAIDEDLSMEDIVNTTFKSLAEAKAWQNPAPEMFEVVPTTIADKRKYGKNKFYIVKERKTLF